MIALRLNLNKKITDQTGYDEKKDVQIMVLLKYLSNFLRTLEISLIYCESNLILTCSVNCFVIAYPINNQKIVFSMNEIKLYVPVATSLTQYNGKLMQQIKTATA